MNRFTCKKLRGLGIVVALAVVAGFAALAMILWNRLLPDIFGLPAINYWQALGLWALSRILFGGIGASLGTLRRHGLRGGDLHRHNPLRERWMGMSEEDRKAFAEKEKDFRAMFNDRFSQIDAYRKEHGDRPKSEGADE
ncbi:MAG: hypothetical protein LBS82_02855 [Spirochaetaceae bacterium]|nr:hypothetical protein [Spirochaetaceae bacterium]